MAQSSSFFSTKDKELNKFWKDQKESRKKSNKKPGYKPGYLLTSKMSRLINIFGEEIDMTVEQKGRKEEYIQEKTCKIGAPEGIKEGLSIDPTETEKTLGFDTEKDPGPKSLDIYTPGMKSLSDFDNLYLGWLQEYSFEKEKEEAHKTLIKKAMRHLFRFVFGTKSIDALQMTKDPRKLAEVIRQVPLSPEEKAPCTNPQDKLWIWFKKCIEYRLQVLQCETVSASSMLNQAHQDNPAITQNLFVKDLATFYTNLYQFNLVLQNNLDRNCLDYTEPARGMGTEPLLDEGDYHRILTVFHEFLEDKFGGNTLYNEGHENDMKALSDKFSDSSVKVKESALETYKAIISLLKTSSVKSLKEELEGLTEETDTQQAYITILNIMLENIKEEERLRDLFSRFASTLEDGTVKKALWMKFFGAKLSEIDELNRKLGAILREKAFGLKGTNSKSQEFLESFVNQYTKLQELMNKMTGKLTEGRTSTVSTGGGKSIHEPNPEYKNLIKNTPEYIEEVFIEIDKLVKMFEGDTLKSIIPHFLNSHPKVLDNLAEAIRDLQNKIESLEQKLKEKGNSETSTPAATEFTAEQKAKLENKLEEVQNKLKEFQLKYNNAETIKNELREKVEELETENTRLVTEKDKATNELTTKQNEFNSQVEETDKEYRKTLTNIKERLDAQSSLITKLEEQLKEAQSLGKKHENNKGELNSKLQKATEKINSLQQELNDTTTSKEDFQKALDDKQNLEEELTQRTKEYNEKVSLLKKKGVEDIKGAIAKGIEEGKAQAVIGLKGDIDKLKEKIENKDIELKNIAINLEDIEGGNITEKIKNLLETSQRVNVLNNDIQDKDETIHYQEAAINDLREQAKLLRTAKANAEAAKNEALHARAIASRTTNQNSVKAAEAKAKEAEQLLKQQFASAKQALEEQYNAEIRKIEEQLTSQESKFEEKEKELKSVLRELVTALEKLVIDQKSSTVEKGNLTQELKEAKEKAQEFETQLKSFLEKEREKQAGLEGKDTQLQNLLFPTAEARTGIAAKPPQPPISRASGQSARRLQVKPPTQFEERKDIVSFIDTTAPITDINEIARYLRVQSPQKSTPNDTIDSINKVLSNFRIDPNLSVQIIKDKQGYKMPRTDEAFEVLIQDYIHKTNNIKTEYTQNARLLAGYYPENLIEKIGNILNEKYIDIPINQRPTYVKNYLNIEYSAKGGGRPTNPPTKNICDLMLTLLMLKAKQSYPEFDAQEFLDKAGATLDDLGQCPLVLHVLNELIDAATEAHASNDINGLDFYNMNKAPLIDKADQIESAINSRFSEEEKQILASMANPMTFYSKAPEEYEPILGTSPYFLTGRPAQEVEEVELYGLDTEDPGPISLSKEERAALEQDGQGVPLGALLFLYLQCLRDLQESGETPALNSKCPLLPKPKRSLSRSRTPKTKAKRPGTRKSTSH